MDKISEMLTKIRNAQMAGHKEVKIRFSKFKFALAKILEKEGFVESVFQDKNKTEDMHIVLKYYQISKTQKMPAIKGIKKVSKLGQRIYVKSKDIKKVKNDFGVVVISTSKGVMAGEQSKKMGLGGEY
ncbi:MAG TPA: 30S ribosomal protein S8, partial [Candidatus Moranbacteria bacterium]|nr:30S ribosomal protein S8 [Candidatus Moranbacteria bacterium]